PEILFSIFSPVTKLTGVGPRIAKLIEKLAGEHVSDLLWHLPSGIIDRRYAPKIAEARIGEIATMTVTVDQHLPPKSRRLPYKILCSDDTGNLTLVFFHARADYLLKILP
ncbi:MAG TPA: ATP-dependent DNA helicase RecG, partial [Rhodospirillales bacterium]|nr:ATP-dependent DNA helicase RecG [Rhodospirillales bacterium]